MTLRANHKYQMVHAPHHRVFHRSGIISSFQSLTNLHKSCGISHFTSHQTDNLFPYFVSRLVPCTSWILCFRSINKTHDHNINHFCSNKESKTHLFIYNMLQHIPKVKNKINWSCSITYTCHLSCQNSKNSSHFQLN